MKEKICTNCVLDNTIPEIEFDNNGVCNFCALHKKFEGKFPIGEEGKQKLNEIIRIIKKRGKNKKYDCIVGISGGVDSTYCAYLAKEWGLRVLTVHLNNGWNSPEADHNIKMISDKLDFDLRIEKVNWGEFKNLQIAFLKASVSDIEIPTDVGIYATLYKVAAEENIPSIINGHSFRQEGSQPISWTYMDGKYISSVYKKFTGKRLKYFNNVRIKEMFYYSVIKGIKEFRPLEYFDYDKQKAGKLLKEKLDWKDYGGHHFESVYTRFVASYILPTKFNIDKRKVSFSAKIRDGKISRDKALELLNDNFYLPEKIEKDKKLVLEKLGVSENEFNKIMETPVKSHLDYPNYHGLVKRFKLLIKLATKFGLVPVTFYEKYIK